MLIRSTPGVVGVVIPVRPMGAAAYRQAGSSAFPDALEPGRQVRAVVQARLPGGAFVVAIDMGSAAANGNTPAAGTQVAERHLLQMRLPAGAQPGDTLELVFVSRDPRPMFMLASGAASQAHAARLSEAGRFVSDLLAHGIPSGARATVSGTTPLLAGPPVDSARLAESLARALGHSGLFYEAHQAQWLAGARTRGELALEPQARLPMNLAGDTSGQAAAATHETVHPDALGLVRQQLDVLETRQANWQGFVWPGQAIEWEVAEDRPEGADGTDPCASAWHTRLSLVLPHLGRVCARLRLDAHGVDVRMEAADPVAAFMLQAATALLAHRMQSASIGLRGVEVRLDGAA
ncbi:flagellar hook-length control protein FliK [Nitrosovibrio sp. Nv17]|uniref:flagellar hook-length control protein FliK n=1 Tax=Nitrosovibrio sp. Nv17 TaxID=1855339 RepID=UPI0009091B5C|nr:flagellar hook-length control protein FliK [Nitrosovibrio sp. Nv17]SFW14579.1 hook-length control protein FliK [Nitrosovibrio sp. Nv17]